MNKPAPKEPSMDEILSSIRQIIADDDAAVAPRRPSTPAAPPQATSPQAAPPPRPISPLGTVPVPRQVEPDPVEPLALTTEQMLREDEPEEPVAALSFGDVLGGEDHTATGPAERAVEPQLIDPEDIAFESEDGPEVEMPTFSVPVESPQAARPVPVPRPAPHPAPSVARAAPMPDPTLSRDMAEQLLAPTTDAAVKHTFAKLNGLSMVGSGVTLEDLMRDMLRPMLKEWLDENLPAVVERMVEKEIARISRGGE